MSFARDGRTLAMALRHQSVRFWDTGLVSKVVRETPPIGRPTRRGEAVRFSVSGEVRMVRFSPDGKRLAVADSAGELILCNVADWKRLAVRTAGTGNVTFAYGGDGRLVIAAGGGRGNGHTSRRSLREAPRGQGAAGGSAHIYLRAGASGDLVGEFPAGDGWVRCLAVSPDGRFVAVSFDSAPPRRPGRRPTAVAPTAVVRLWDISGEPKLLGTTEEVPDSIRALAFGPDGKTLYAAAGRTVRHWRTETREGLPALEGAQAELEALAVAPNGRVYAAGQDMMIHVWDPRGRHGVPLEGHTDAITGLSLTADGRLLASVARDGTCRLWDTARGETTAVTAEKSQVYGSTATGLPALSPDGSLLAVGAGYQVVSVLWTDQLKGRPPRRNVPEKKPSTERGAVLALGQVGTYFFVNAGFGDNHTLLTANNVGALQRWDWPGGRLRDVWQHPSAVHDLARSRDGKLLALAAGNAVYLRDGDSGKLRASVSPEHAGTDPWARLVRIALSPGGDLLAMALTLKNGHEVIVWDVKEGRQVGIANPPSAATSLDFSPDGKTLAAGLAFDGAMLYDSRDLKEGKLVARNKRGVAALAFSPDGKRLATSSDNGLVKVWDLERDKELWSKPWSLPNAWRQSVCFSPDGKWLVAAPLAAGQGRLGLVLVDAADGKLRTEVTRYPMPNSDPSFSPDGKFLAVVLKVPGQVVVYDVDKLLAPP